MMDIAVAVAVAVVTNKSLTEEITSPRLGDVVLEGLFGGGESRISTEVAQKRALIRLLR